MMNQSSLMFLVIIFPLLTTVRGSCFFPTELQGSYAVQYTEGDPNDIWYRSISISYDFISGLGSCVFRQSSLYVLRSEAGCYKCAWIRQRSDNVLSLSESGQCHNTAESAWQYCDNIKVPTTSSMTAATQLYNNNIRDDIDEVRTGPGFVLDNCPERVELAS